MSVFGIWPILEIHRGMWPNDIFSHFHEHVFAFVGFKLFLAFCPFLKSTEACDLVIHFSRFHERFWYFAHFRNAHRHAIPLSKHCPAMASGDKVRNAN